MSYKDVKFINSPLTFQTNVAVAPAGGNAFFCADHRDVLLTVVGTGNVKVYGSTQATPPDFTLPSTVTNSYTEIALADYSLATNSILAGSAGVTVANSTKIVELNTNLLTWISVVRSADTVEVLLTITNSL